MRTDRIYIARDGKSGMHVLVRILAVGDIGADCLPIDPDGFNELMMARDARSLVLAAKGLGPMLASEPSWLLGCTQQGAESPPPISLGKPKIPFSHAGGRNRSRRYLGCEPAPCMLDLIRDAE